jgi:hypothetical protein
MAGDWIKMRTDLYRDPKVCLIADALLEPTGELARFVNQHLQCDMAVTRNVMRNVTVGALVTVWGVMRLRGKRIGVDLVCSRVTLPVLDDMADLPGFGDAMSSVGWVEETDEGVVFPRFFDDYNVDPTDKKASSAAERQRRYRERAKANGDANRDVTRDVTVTHREEKSREESIEASARSPGADGQEVIVTDGNGNPTASVIATLTAAQSAVVVKACQALRKMGALRFHPGDEVLAALAVEGFTAEQIVRCAGEKALRDAGLWNDPDVHPDLFDLLVNGASQQDMGLTPQQFAAVRSAVTQVPTGYIASTLRGRRRDAVNGSPPARSSSKNTARKPSATDNFEGTSYVGTAIDKLPPEIRAGFEPRQASNG